MMLDLWVSGYGLQIRRRGIRSIWSSDSFFPNPASRAEVLLLIMMKMVVTVVAILIATAVGHQHLCVVANKKKPDIKQLKVPYQKQCTLS